MGTLINEYLEVFRVLDEFGDDFRIRNACYFSQCFFAGKMQALVDGVSFIGRWIKAAADDIADFLARGAGVFGNRFVVAGKFLRDDRFDFSFERSYPADHFIEHDAQGEDIAAMGDHAVVVLFRAHVIDRSEGRGGLLSACQGNAEVHEFDRAGRGDHDIFGLDVFVDNAFAGCAPEGIFLFFCVVQGFADKGYDCKAEGWVQGPVCLEHLAEGFSLDVLHFDEWQAGWRNAAAVDADDIRVVQLGADFAFVVEFPSDAGRKAGLKDLYGPFHFKVDFESQVDDAHSALADDFRKTAAAQHIAYLGQGLLGAIRVWGKGNVVFRSCIHVSFHGGKDYHRPYEITRKYDMLADR